jgi:transposase
MLQHLAPEPSAVAPTVVLDAGIATEENLAWLTKHGYRYLVVSRERHKQFDAESAVLIRAEGDTQIRAQRVVDAVTGEVRLYCHSTGREAKERGIERRFSTRLEADLQYLAEGLQVPGRVKRYEKVLTRIGRLRQRYARVARSYDIRLEKDVASGNAKALVWTRILPTEETLPGVYCLRTNQADWEERTLWNTYTMLTDLEAVFRSLKSELGLRPIYHHKSARVDGHLFISVLAYHLVHSLRIRLKAQGIHMSWESLRNQFAGQERVTVVLHRDDGQIYHIRKATRPEPHQQILYNALGLPHLPGKTEKTLIDPRAEVSQM